MSTLEVWRMRCRFSLALFYLLGGVFHLYLPVPFLRITPAWVPDAALVIFLTGVFEIAGAWGLMLPKVRRFAGIMLALYAVCVYPANIKHAIDSLSAGDTSIWLWLYHIVRLPLQPVIIWLAVFCGGAVDWPFDQRERLP